jgi:hypothetical protein
MPLSRILESSIVKVLNIRFFFGFFRFVQLKNNDRLTVGNMIRTAQALVQC